MFRLMQMFCALVVLLNASSTARAQIEKSKYCPTDTQFNALEAVVRITIWTAKGGALGSGVCVGNDGKFTYILTCEHLIRGADKTSDTKIEFFSKKSYPTPSHVHTVGFKFWYNEGYDLALLKVPVECNNILKICPYNADLKWNIPVLHIGCGAGAPPVCQIGKLIAQDESDDFVINRGGTSGRSGGAVICAKGLIGIHARGGEDRSYAVNHWKIHKFLKNIGQGWLLSGSPPTPSAVAGTTWSGKESLEGFGQLTFQFHANGKAVMIDSKNTVNGEWAQKGAKVVIAFSNCIYLAEVNGQKMAGTATYIKEDQPHGQPWTFALTRQ